MRIRFQSKNGLPRRVSSRVVAWLPAVATLLALIGGTAAAVSTRHFLLDDDETLAEGELDGTAVHSDGSVTPGVKTERFGLSDAAVAYAIATRRDGTTFIGTGNDGNVYRFKDGSVEPFAQTDALVVASLVLADDGTLYAGTLPDGKIVAIDRQGNVRDFAALKDAQHVWALAYDAKRKRLYAATGPEGKVFVVDPQGRAQVYYDARAAHVMALALDRDGTLYAGTSDEAVVLRLQGPGRADVVRDIEGNEITALDVEQGRLAVAANEFPKAKLRARQKRGDPSKTTATERKRPKPGEGRLWRIDENGRAVQLLHEKKSHFASVEIDEDGVVYAGDGQKGRIYRANPDGTTAVWVDVDERQVLALNLLGDAPLFTTGDGAAVYRARPASGEEAQWTSDVLDAEFLARWGQLHWRGEGRMRFRTRSGNTKKPDDTWSEWSSPSTSPGPVRSPGARYLQVRAALLEKDSILYAVAAHYLPKNQPARVHGIRVASKGKDNDDKDDDAPIRGKGEPPEPSTEYEAKWKVDNPDDDELRFRLFFRAEGQPVWRRILEEGEELKKNEYEWETSGLPDGYYRLRVEASDEPSSPHPYALTTQGLSEPFLIDNHAPDIEGLRATGKRVQGRARDAVGPISRLEYAIDGDEWRLFFPADDLLDTADEAFDLELPDLGPGPHIIAIRATDAAGNTRTAEIIVKGSGAPDATPTGRYPRLR